MRCTSVSVKAGFVRIMRMLCFAILLPIASAGALPAWVHLFVPDAHICQCGTREHAYECFCLRCNPDRTDLISSDETVKGRCGGEEGAFGVAKLLALPTPSWSVVIAPPSSTGEARAHPLELVDQTSARPPKPPPKVSFRS